MYVKFVSIQEITLRTDLPDGEHKTAQGDLLFTVEQGKVVDLDTLTFSDTTLEGVTEGVRDLLQYCHEGDVEIRVVVLDYDEGPSGFVVHGDAQERIIRIATMHITWEEWQDAAVTSAS